LYSSVIVLESARGVAFGEVDLDDRVAGALTNGSMVTAPKRRFQVLACYRG